MSCALVVFLGTGGGNSAVPLVVHCGTPLRYLGGLRGTLGYFLGALGNLIGDLRELWRYSGVVWWVFLGSFKGTLGVPVP